MIPTCLFPAAPPQAQHGMNRIPPRRGVDRRAQLSPSVPASLPTGTFRMAALCTAMPTSARPSASSASPCAKVPPSASLSPRRCTVTRAKTLRYPTWRCWMRRRPPSRRCRPRRWNTPRASSRRSFPTSAFRPRSSTPIRVLSSPVTRSSPPPASRAARSSTWPRTWPGRCPSSRCVSSRPSPARTSWGWSCPTPAARACAFRRSSARVPTSTPSLPSPSRWARTSPATPSSPIWRRCPTCWWPAPPAPASPWASTPC